MPWAESFRLSLNSPTDHRLFYQVSPTTLRRPCQEGKVRSVDSPPRSAARAKTAFLLIA